MPDLHAAFWPKRLPRTLTLPETTLWYNLEVSARRYPHKAAIVYYGRELTYEALRDEATALAGYLRRELGVRPGERVLLCMQNCPQFVIAYYATLRAGAAVVPLSPMLITPELRFFAQDSGARIVLTAQDRFGQFAPLLAEGTLAHAVVATYGDYRGAPDGVAIPEVVAAPRAELRETRAVAWGDALSAGAVPDPEAATPDDLAVIPYTSGTTGKPKGCLHTHRTVQATTVAGVVWGRGTPDGVGLVTLPLFHVTGMQSCMNAPIFAGGTSILMTRWDRDTAAALIERYGCTHWINISTMMVDFIANPQLGRYDLSSLASIGGGGAALPAAVGQYLRDRMGLEYLEGYGLSETIAATHANPPDRPKLQCLGIPLFGVDARVLDPETGRELGPNEDGEIVLAGPQVFRGYWNRPEETEAAFLTLDGKRFFRTGDLGHYDEEGYYFAVDRLKRMINASGYKVWPAEVEALLYQHPAVQEACVIATPDPRRGETVKAVIVPRAEAREHVTAEEIIAWAREQMAAYKYPRVVEFAESLPRSASGKVLWRELQERERARATEAAATPLPDTRG